MSRETKKAPQPVPQIPDLGRLHHPRKGNKRAAKAIANGVLRWDERHIARTLRRRELQRQEERREQARRQGDLPVELRRSLLRHLGSNWYWYNKHNTLRYRPHTELDLERIAQLCRGVEQTLIDNPVDADNIITLRVTGLNDNLLHILKIALPTNVRVHAISVQGHRVLRF